MVTLWLGPALRHIRWGAAADTGAVGERARRIKANEVANRYDAQESLFCGVLGSVQALVSAVWRTTRYKKLNGVLRRNGRQKIKSLGTFLCS